MVGNLLPLKTILVPRWIHSALVRCKLNNIDLSNYGKVRQVVSIDDMAEWCYLADKFCIDGVPMSVNSVLLFDAMTEEQKHEFNISVLPLSVTDEIAANAMSKLRETSPTSRLEYSFLSLPDKIYIILHEGFMTRIQEPSYLKEFVAAYLKACYAMISIPEVSALPLYRLYLNKFSQG